MMTYRRANLVDQAYEKLKENILNGHFRVNQKLGYKYLEKLLSMSKTSFLGALDRLTAEGLIYYKRNCGYFVKFSSSEKKQLKADFNQELDLNDSYLATVFSPVPFNLPVVKDINEEIHQKIKELIINGKFNPGQKLIYSELEKILGVSKTPIINALIRLKCEGLVKQKQNFGFYVKEINFDEIFQLFDARLYLELCNIPNIIKNCTKDDIKKLKGIKEDYEKYPESILDCKRLKKNTLFHLSIARIGKNSFIIKFLEQIYDWIELRMPLTFEFLPSDRIKKINSEHQEIFKAIFDKNEKNLKIAFNNHLKAPSMDISNYIKKKNFNNSFLLKSMKNIALFGKVDPSIIK